VAIEYRSSSTATASGTTLTISKPSGTADGDILLAIIAAFTFGALTSVSAPSGWTEIARGYPDENLWAVIFWKRASSEGASYDFTCSGGSGNQMTGALLAYSGAASSGDPIHTYSNTAYTTYNDILRAAGVTTTTQPTMLVMLGGHGQPSVSITPPSGYTERVDNATTWVSTYAADKYWTSSGATGDVDATFNSYINSKHTFLVALREDVARAQFIGQRVW